MQFNTLHDVLHSKNVAVNRPVRHVPHVATAETWTVSQDASPKRRYARITRREAAERRKWHLYSQIVADTALQPLARLPTPSALTHDRGKLVLLADVDPEGDTTFLELGKDE